MENKVVKTSLGLEENIESMLCYAGVWVTGLLFFLLEKDNRNVKFHALQSLIAFLALSVITYVLGRIFLFGYLLWLATILVWILLMIKAYQGERFKLPWVGDLVESILGSEPAPAAPVAQKEEAPETVQPGPEVQESSSAQADQADDKEALLKAVEAALSVYPELSVARSSETDLEIKSNPGAKKVDYSACLLVRGAEHLVLYWEMMKESGVKEDFQPQDKSFEVERNGLNGRKIAGQPLDFEQARGIVETTVKGSGWAFKTVLGKSKAMYPK